MKRTLTWSYGGGVQSVAIAVLVAQGKLPVPTVAIIADTSRESSATWEYMAEHVQPMLAPTGLQIQIAPHSLASVDLYSNGGELLMPTYTQNGMMSTFCSDKWKARPVQKYLRSLGYGPENPVSLWIGMSLDETDRVKFSGIGWVEHTYPLVFDVPLRRTDCQVLIAEAGLPPAPKSSCWCCPFRRDHQWREMKENQPDDFAKACVLDVELRDADKKGGVWLHESRKPLAEVDFSEDQSQGHLFTGCSTGYCWS